MNEAAREHFADAALIEVIREQISTQCECSTAWLNKQPQSYHDEVMAGLMAKGANLALKNLLISFERLHEEAAKLD